MRRLQGGCLKSRAALYSLVGFGVASSLMVALYMLLHGQQHAQLPRCWLFEPDDNGTCDKVGDSPPSLSN